MIDDYRLIGTGSRRPQAALIGLHLDAHDEICLPAVRQAAPHGQARAVLDEHEQAPRMNAVPA